MAEESPASPTLRARRGQPPTAEGSPPNGATPLPPSPVPATDVGGSTGTTWGSTYNNIRSNFGEYLRLFIVPCIVTILSVMVFYGVSAGYSVLKIPTVANFLILFCALTLLAYFEALHYIVTSIQKWDMELFEEKYPRVVKCWKLVDTPVKVKRFMLGRQFFVILSVFLIAQITSFPDIPTNFIGLPAEFIVIFLRTGLPGIAIVFTFGQLVSQLFQEDFTIEFLNMYGCEFCIRLALGAEYLGVCNCSWLLFHGTALMACGNVRAAKKIIKQRRSSEALFEMETAVMTVDNGSKPPVSETNDSQTDFLAVSDSSKINQNYNNDLNITPSSSRRYPNLEILPASVQHTLTDPIPSDDIETGALIERGAHFETGLNQKIYFGWPDYFKFLVSTFATMGSVAIILYGISIRAYVLPVEVSGAYVIAIIMMTNLFYLEGLMIAIVGTQNWDPEIFKHAYPRAYQLHQLISKSGNMKRFIIGRQFFTVLTNFLLAQLFTFNNFPNPGWNPVLFYVIIKSGLVGVLVTLACGQLIPELLAAEYPLRFMNMYYSYWVVWISLMLDFIGVGHGAWLVYFSSQSLFCRKYMKEKALKAQQESQPQELVQVESAEILAHDMEMMLATHPNRRQLYIIFRSLGTTKGLEPPADEDESSYAGSPRSVLGSRVGSRTGSRVGSRTGSRTGSRIGSRSGSPLPTRAGSPVPPSSARSSSPISSETSMVNTTPVGSQRLRSLHASSAMLISQSDFSQVATSDVIYQPIQVLRDDSVGENIGLEMN